MTKFWNQNYPRRSLKFLTWRFLCPNKMDFSKWWRGATQLMRKWLQPSFLILCALEQPIHRKSSLVTEFFDPSAATCKDWAGHQHHFHTLSNPSKSGVFPTRIPTDSKMWEHWIPHGVGDPGKLEVCSHNISRADSAPRMNPEHAELLDKSCPYGLGKHKTTEDRVG